MARAAHSWYLRNTYVENNLIKPGKVQLKGVPLDLGQMRLDIYAVGAEKDHIVPWDAAWRDSATRRWKNPLRARVEWSHCGHHQSARRKGQLLDERQRNGHACPMA